MTGLLGGTSRENKIIHSASSTKSKNKSAHDITVLSPANGYGEKRDFLGAALLLCSDGSLQRQTHAVTLVRKLHIRPTLWAQAA